MDHSPLHPMIWAVFCGFIIVLVLAVRVHHARRPDYPGTDVRKASRKPADNDQE